MEETKKCYLCNKVESDDHELTECSKCGKLFCHPDYGNCGEGLGYDGEFPYCNKCMETMQKCECSKCANRDDCTEEYDFIYDCPDYEKKKVPLNEWVKEVHQNAVDHGWWEEERTFGEIIALIHSECSEALEAYRNGEEPIHYLENGKPDGMAIELADVVIRVMDYFGKQGWDLEEAIEKKHNYNISRSHKHGGKKI